MPGGKVLAPEAGGLRVVVYPGNNMALIAMSLEQDVIDEDHNNFAGFAIWRTPKGKPEQPLFNRLNFKTQITSAIRPEDRKWTETFKAPFQKFRWVDVPPGGFDEPITYRVVAKYFTGQGTTMRDGPTTSVTVDPPQRAHGKFRVGFTRGYASSQAYADRFHNAPIRPKGPKTPDFDTTPYVQSGQYEWLGADARKRLFEFIEECENDGAAKVDVFAYDLD